MLPETGFFVVVGAFLRGGFDFLPCVFHGFTLFDFLDLLVLIETLDIVLESFLLEDFLCLLVGQLCNGVDFLVLFRTQFLGSRLNCGFRLWNVVLDFVLEGVGGERLVLLRLGEAEGVIRFAVVVGRIGCSGQGTRVLFLAVSLSGEVVHNFDVVVVFVDGVGLGIAFRGLSWAVLLRVDWLLGHEGRVVKLDVIEVDLVDVGVVELEVEEINQLG